jgi:AcrR family transcriptional regulator
VRRLIYVPIIHGPEDLGSRLEDVRRAYLARYGLRAWQQHLKSVEQFWEEVRHSVRRFPQETRKLRIYQDGLPVCGRELELAQQLAVNGSRNHRLIVELVEQGALLTGTEDPELLKREQERSQDAVGLSQPASASRYDALMEQRDRYIAAQIDATLQAEGEVGLLFMGALHRVVERLPKDIEVVRLHGR